MKTDRPKKTLLTVPFIKSLKPEDQAFEIMDTEVRAFGIRVQAATGAKSFILRMRFPGSNPYQPPQHPVRRTIAHFPETSLSAARELARDWRAMIKRGVDPSTAAKKEAAANIEAAHKEEQEKVTRAGNTVEAALKAYLLAKSNLRTHAKKNTDMRRILAPWGVRSRKGEAPPYPDRAIRDVTTEDIEALITAIKDRGKKGQALAAYALIKGLFSWALKSRRYGLIASPCDLIDTKTLVGKTRKIERYLDDAEIRAFWKATETALDYPSAPFFRLLLLTGLRESEVADASWPEFKLEERRWIIEAERMKGEDGEAKPHLIPLTDEIMSLLDPLPRHAGGDFLFSNYKYKGAIAVSAFSKMKRKIDAAMKIELAKEGHPFKAWRIHDTRRTVTTKMASLEISESHIDRVTAHAQPEISQRYNLYGYERQKREALEKWHRELRKIVSPEELRAVA